jgi:hypothetical protein
LKSAQQKVEILLKRGNTAEIEPFSVAEDETGTPPSVSG